MCASTAPKDRAPLGFGDAKANYGPRSPVLPSLRGPTLAELHVAWGQKGAGRSPRTESVPFSLGFPAL